MLNFRLVIDIGTYLVCSIVGITKGHTWIVGKGGLWVKADCG